MRHLFVASILLISNSLAYAQDTPPRNIESWGVCPFECCTYGPWTADADIPIHKARDEQSAVLFNVARGEAVDGVTGVVVAAMAETIILDRAVRDGYEEGNDQPLLSLAAGEAIYLVAPLGEGAFRFWYKGHIYSSGNALSGMASGHGPRDNLIWWKQVRNRSGASGWTRSEQFQHVDACG